MFGLFAILATVYASGQTVQANEPTTHRIGASLGKNSINFTVNGQYLSPDSPEYRSDLKPVAWNVSEFPERVYHFLAKSEDSPTDTWIIDTGEEGYYVLEVGIQFL